MIAEHEQRHHFLREMRIWLYVLKEKKFVEMEREKGYRDDLTGLYKKVYGKEMLIKELNEAGRYRHPVSTIFGDVDNFRKYNEQFGHITADHALKHISSVILSTLRSYDFGIRYGGEEFLLVLPNTSHKNARNVLKRLEKKLGTKAQYPTISFGMATNRPKRLYSMEEAIKRAETLINTADKRLKMTADRLMLPVSLLIHAAGSNTHI